MLSPSLTTNDGWLRCATCGAVVSGGAEHCLICGAQAGVAGACPGVSVGDALEPLSMVGNGRYRIERVLGQGGFGITYEARDLSTGETVAIKELFPTGCVRRGGNVEVAGRKTSGDFLDTKRRFLNEARMIERFRHPGIVRVEGCFEENNTAYLVMEFLHGATVADWLQAHGVMSESEALHCARSICTALEVVHDAGLLHRDVKPENIFVAAAAHERPAREPGLAGILNARIVLIDFGIAREVAGAPDTMTVMLTPGYAPLEQYARLAGRGPYSDVYAVAATLYHMVTGRAPVPATDRVAGVELPDISRLNRHVNAGFARAVMHGLAIEISRRPACARDFFGALAAGDQGLNSHQGFQGPPAAIEPLEPDGRMQQNDSLVPGRPWITAEAHAPRTEPAVRLLRTISWRNYRPACVAYSPDGGLLASTGDESDTIAVFKVATSAADRPPSSGASGPAATLLPARGHGVCAAGIADAWRHYRLGQFPERPTLVLTGHRHQVTAFAFAPGGELLASGGYDCSVMAWNPRNGRRTQNLRGHREAVTAVAFSPDGAWFASGSIDGTVHIWSRTPDRLKFVWHDVVEFAHPGLTSLQFSPNGSLLATGGTDSVVRLWHVPSHGKPTAAGVLEGHGSAVTSLAFDPDGGLLASASFDRTARVWRLGRAAHENGVARLGATSRLHTLNEHGEIVTSVTFMPASAFGGGTRQTDGAEGGIDQHGDIAGSFSSVRSLLACGSYDGRISLWDAASGALLRVLKTNSQIGALAFSPDGACLAATSADGLTHVWKTHG